MFKVDFSFFRPSTQPNRTKPSKVCVLCYVERGFSNLENYDIKINERDVVALHNERRMDSTTWKHENVQVFMSLIMLNTQFTS